MFHDSCRYFWLPERIIPAKTHLQQSFLSVPQFPGQCSQIGAGLLERRACVGRGGEVVGNGAQFLHRLCIGVLLEPGIERRHLRQLRVMLPVRQRRDCTARTSTGTPASTVAAR